MILVMRPEGMLEPYPGASFSGCWGWTWLCASAASSLRVISAHKKANEVGVCTARVACGGLVTTSLDGSRSGTSGHHGYCGLANPISGRDYECVAFTRPQEKPQCPHLSLRLVRARKNR